MMIADMRTHTNTMCGYFRCQRHVCCMRNRCNAGTAVGKHSATAHVGALCVLSTCSIAFLGDGCSVGSWVPVLC